MKITIASIGGRAAGKAFEELATLYMDRIAPYAAIDSLSFRSEAALHLHVDRMRRRTAPLLVLLDSRGRSFQSEEFAAWLGRQRDAGQQALVFAIGPPDGWTAAARGQAQMLLAFGPMTLPHELVTVVVAEQIYRAFTILAGHPYHSGHTG